MCEAKAQTVAPRTAFPYDNPAPTNFKDQMACPVPQRHSSIAAVEHTTLTHSVANASGGSMRVHFTFTAIIEQEKHTSWVPFEALYCFMNF